MTARHSQLWHQTRPPAHRLGSAHYRHGPLQPMPQRPSLIARLLGFGK